MTTDKIVVVDDQKMLVAIQDFPNQLEKAWTTTWIKDIQLDIQRFNQVLILGMGGSGIAGKLLSEQFKTKLPITIWQDYDLPTPISEKTLVIALSFSGETEETLDGVRKAIEKKLQVVAISSGGKLEELSQIHGFPFFKIDYIGQPRAALGWLYGTLLTITAKIGLINLTEQTYFQAMQELKTLVEGKTLHEKAEDLAMILSNKLPVIAASRPLSTVAQRWVTQLNENSKSLSIYLAMPELCHNFIVGLPNPSPEKVSIVYLDSSYSFSRNVTRRKLIEKQIRQSEVSFTPITLRSGSALAEQLILIYFGDLVSYYLAGVYGVDPTPVEAITALKDDLKRSQ